MNPGGRRSRSSLAAFGAAVVLVCPLLLDMRSKRLEGPLAQYQSRSASNKEQVYDLVKAINKCDGQPVLDRYLSSTFKKYWEDFDTRVREIKEMDIPRDLLAEASAQPDITFDCTQEEFVNHLSSCDEVTILGITNRSLPGCLEQAWEKARGPAKLQYAKALAVLGDATTVEKGRPSRSRERSK